MMGKQQSKHESNTTAMEVKKQRRAVVLFRHALCKGQVFQVGNIMSLGTTNRMFESFPMRASFFVYDNLFQHEMCISLYIF